MAITKKIDMTGAFLPVAGPGGMVTFTAPAAPLHWVLTNSLTPSTMTVGHIAFSGVDTSLKLGNGEYLQLHGGAGAAVAVTAENEV